MQAGIAKLTKNVSVCVLMKFVFMISPLCTVREVFRSDEIIKSALSNAW